jgi:hypothetical protein
MTHPPAGAPPLTKVLSLGSSLRAAPGSRTGTECATQPPRRGGVYRPPTQTGVCPRPPLPSTAPPRQEFTSVARSKPPPHVRLCERKRHLRAWAFARPARPPRTRTTQPHPSHPPWSPPVYRRPPCTLAPARRPPSPAPTPPQSPTTPSHRGDAQSRPRRRAPPIVTCHLPPCHLPPVVRLSMLPVIPRLGPPPPAGLWLACV